MQQNIGPSSEFYEERLARARALPEAARSADVRQWLRLHEELEAASAVLPLVPASATAQRPLVERLGGDAALAALLRLLVAVHSDSPCDPQHPKSTLVHLAPQLPPFMHVCWQEGTDNQAGAAAGGTCYCLLVVLIAAFHSHQCKRVMDPRLVGPLHTPTDEGAPVLCPPQLMLKPELALIEIVRRGGAEADVGAIAGLLLVAHVSSPAGAALKPLPSVHWLADWALLLAPSYLVDIIRPLASVTRSALAAAARFAPLNVTLARPLGRYR